MNKPDYGLIFKPNSILPKMHNIIGDKTHLTARSFAYRQIWHQIMGQIVIQIKGETIQECKEFIYE
jgi:hypothetical protein